MKNRIFRDHSEACEDSRYKRAVGRYGKIRHNGKEISVEITKEYQGEPYMVYSGTNIKIRKATAREVDQIKAWRPW